MTKQPQITLCSADLDKIQKVFLKIIFSNLMFKYHVTFIIHVVNVTTKNEHSKAEALIKANVSYAELCLMFNDHKISFNVFNAVAKTCTTALEPHKS